MTPLELADRMEFEGTSGREFHIRKLAEEMAQGAHRLFGDPSHHYFPIKVHHNEGVSLESPSLPGGWTGYRTIVVNLPEGLGAEVFRLLAEEQIRAQYRELKIPLPVVA